MSFVSLKKQFPDFADAFSQKTAKEVVKTLKKGDEQKKSSRLLQLVNRIVNSSGWQENRELKSLALAAIDTLEKRPQLRRDDLVFRRCKTAVHSLKPTKSLVSNVSIDELGAADAKQKTNKLLTLVSKVVHTCKGWQEDEELRQFACAGVEYLQAHPQICTDKVVYNRCQRAVAALQAESSQRVERPGVENVGNTCYIGATLQAMRHSQGFMNALQQGEGENAGRVHQLLATLQEGQALDEEVMEGFLGELQDWGYAEERGNPGDAADFYHFLATSSGLPLVQYAQPRLGVVSNSYVTVLDDARRNIRLDLNRYLREQNISLLGGEAIPSCLPIVINQLDRQRQGSLAAIPYQLEVPVLAEGEEEATRTFSLKAIVTNGNGHARTWVPTMVDGDRKWMLYDDARVRMVDDTERVRREICGQAYLILFDKI